jgi:hypothetical protein
MERVNRPFGWNCDGRHQENELGCRGNTDFSTRYRCISGCDYDLCGKCMGSIPLKPAEEVEAVCAKMAAGSAQASESAASPADRRAAVPPRNTVVVDFGDDDVRTVPLADVRLLEGEGVSAAAMAALAAAASVGSAQAAGMDNTSPVVAAFSHLWTDVEFQVIGDWIGLCFFVYLFFAWKQVERAARELEPSLPTFLSSTSSSSSLLGDGAKGKRPPIVIKSATLELSPRRRVDDKVVQVPPQSVITEVTKHVARGQRMIDVTQTLFSVQNVQKITVAFTIGGGAEQTQTASVGSKLKFDDFAAKGDAPAAGAAGAAAAAAAVIAVPSAAAVSAATSSAAVLVAPGDDKSGTCPFCHTVVPGLLTHLFLSHGGCRAPHTHSHLVLVQPHLASTAVTAALAWGTDETVSVPCGTLLGVVPGKHKQPAFVVCDACATHHSGAKPFVLTAGALPTSSPAGFAAVFLADKALLALHAGMLVARRPVAAGNLAFDPHAPHGTHAAFATFASLDDAQQSALGVLRQVCLPNV